MNDAYHLREELLTRINFRAENNPSGIAREYLERIDSLYGDEGFLHRDDVATLHGVDASSIPSMDPAAYETYCETQDDRVSRILRALKKIAESYDSSSLRASLDYYRTNFLCSRCAN